MPCVVCKANTQNGFRYCNPCMEKDQKGKRLESEIKPNFSVQQKPISSVFTSNNIDELKLKDSDLDIELFKPIEKKTEKKIEKKVIFEENKIIDHKKQQLIDEMKSITYKLNNMEKTMNDVFNSVFILVSQDTDKMVHLHGVYSNIDKANINFKRISEEADKYSKIVKLEKIILYNTPIDGFDNSFDTCLLDDCDMEIVMKKEYKMNDILIRN